MLAKFLQNKYLNGATPLAVFPMEGRREHFTRGTSRESNAVQVTNEIVLAVLIEEDRMQPGEAPKLRRAIRFFPGVTGHESYFLDENFRQTLAETQDRGPEKGFFGPKINMWYLCAGTPGRWDALSVTVEDVRAAVAYFDQVAPEKKAPPTEAGYVRFSESNDAEGETWYFYLPVAGNEPALTKLRTCLQELREAGETDFHLGRRRYSEQEVDERVARQRPSGYLAQRTKLTGRLDLTRLLHPTPEEQEESRRCGAAMVEHHYAMVLYKGGIRDLFLQDELQGTQIQPAEPVPAQALPNPVASDGDSCCGNERRNMNGGCDNCGDPCI
jgi:hypothetical protein